MEGFEDLFNPKSRTEEFNPNMILLSKNVYLNVDDSPGAGFYIKYDHMSCIAEVGIPQANFIQMTTKWTQLMQKKLNASKGGVGPIG